MLSLGDIVAVVVSSFTVKLCNASVVDSGFIVNLHVEASWLGFGLMRAVGFSGAQDEPGLRQVLPKML